MREHRSMFLFVRGSFFLGWAGCAAESTKVEFHATEYQEAFGKRKPSASLNPFLKP